MNEFNTYICKQCLVYEGIREIKFPKLVTSFEGKCKSCGNYTEVFNKEEVKNHNKNLM
jgi:predicted nucleic-acid-binding Zn-ribbon protein